MAAKIRGGDADSAVTGVLNAPAAVIDPVCIQREIAAVGGDRAAVIDYPVLMRQRQILCAELDNLPLGVVQPAAAQRQCAGAQPAAVVINAVRRHRRERVGGGHRRVVQFQPSGRAQRDGVGGAAAALQREILCRYSYTVLRQLQPVQGGCVRGVQDKVAALRESAVVIDAGRHNGPAGVTQRPTVRGDMASCDELFPVIHIPGRFQLNISPSADGARVGEAIRQRHLHVRGGGKNAAVLQLTVGAQAQFANLCPDDARIAHANPMLRADQLNFVAIHAADRGDIQRKGGRIARALFLPYHVALRIGDIMPGGDGQLLGMQLGVDLHRAADQPGVVTLHIVHAAAADGNLASVYLKPRDSPLLQQRLRGGHRGLPGIDKATAVTGDPGRIGNNHVRPLTRHLNKTVELARVGAVDLIENDLRLAFCQPRVGGDHAAQLRLRMDCAVIEDGAFTIDIELTVLITGYPIAVGGLNIHLRRTVGAGEHRRLSIAGRRAVRHNTAGAGGQGNPAQQQHHGQTQWGDDGGQLSGIHAARGPGVIRAMIFG